MVAKRLEVIHIVNEVERKLGLTISSSLTDRAHTQVLLQLLNEVVADCNDYGNWQETYIEISVTAQTSVAQYGIPASKQTHTPASGSDTAFLQASALASKEVHHIEELSFGNQPSPLELRSIEDIRRLRRTSKSATGNPRQWAIMGANSSGDPVIEVFPQPGSAQGGNTFNIAAYVQEPLFTTADISAIPVFPATVLIQGLYAKALLEQEDGAPTPTAQAEIALYERRKREALNRYTTDTGTSIHIYPGNFADGGPWRSK